MNDLLKSYIEIFGQDEELHCIDQLFIQYLETQNYQEALLYAFNHKYSNCCCFLYCSFDVLFPIDIIIDLISKIEDKSAKIYSIQYSTSLGLDLDCTKIVLNDDTKRLYGAQLKIIQFILECRRYSKHKMISGKFYYQYDKKYSYKVEQLLKQLL